MVEGEDFVGTAEQLARVDTLPGACTARVGSDGVLRLTDDKTGREIPLHYVHYPQEGEEPGPPQVNVVMSDEPRSKEDIQRIEKLKRFAKRG